MVLNCDASFTASYETKISPLVLAIFLKYSGDPVLTSLVQDVFKVGWDFVFVFVFAESWNIYKMHYTSARLDSICLLLVRLFLPSCWEGVYEMKLGRETCQFMGFTSQRVS